MCLYEYAVDPGRDAGPGKDGEKLPIATAWILTRDPVLSNGMGDIEHDRVTDLVQQQKAARVDDQVVIPERVTPLREYDLLASGSLDLLHGLRHVVRRDELTVLQVHHGPGLRGRDHELALHAEVGGYLQHVHNLGGRGRLGRIVDVG